MNLNQTLGESACRKLTEWLGEPYYIIDITKQPSYRDNCQHDWTDARRRNGLHCVHCGAHGNRWKNEIDFSDPRAVVRLLRKTAAYSVSHVNDTWSTAIVWDKRGTDFDGEGSTDEEAVCRAVLAFIEEGEK